jgi:porphyrinogen peroxidase
MFVADADGVYDRLLDFSRAVTGAHFFAPSLEVLEALADPPTPAVSEIAAGAEPAPAGSVGALGIGSLRAR